MPDCMQTLNPYNGNCEVTERTVVGYVEGVDIDPPEPPALIGEAIMDTVEKFDFSHLNREKQVMMQRFLSDHIVV